MDQSSQQQPNQQSQPAAKPPQQHANADLFSDLTIGLPTPFRLLNESFMLLRHKFLHFALTLSFPLLLVFLLSKGQAMIIESIPPWLGMLLTIASAIIKLLILSWGYLALLFAIKDNEENISIFEGYKRANKRLIKYWRLLVLLFAVCCIGLAFFIVPGIIVGVFISMALFVFVVEDLSGVDTLLQSKAYVQKYWLPVLERWIFIGLFACIAYLPFFLLSAIDIPYMKEAARFIGIIMIIPVVSTFSLLVYGNLRVLRGDTSEYVSALKAIPSSKEKIKLFIPTFVKGSTVGVPLVLFLIYMFVTRPFFIQGDSMFPSYVHNQFLMTNRLAYNASLPKRGDVLIFRSPIDPETNMIKRVIGLPGEKIIIEESIIYINGKSLDERKYLSSDVQTTQGEFLKEGYEFSIPQGHFVVLGDNRSNSDDSRNWGPIRMTDIIGEAGMCLWNCPKGTRE